LPDALKTEALAYSPRSTRDTLRAKLGMAFRRYKISAPNPALACALQTELEVGVMLPCNDRLRDGDRTVVTAVGPMQTLAAHDDSCGRSPRKCARS
jgi:hypothetical protein